MVQNHFYNITPKKCIQLLWAYTLVVVGLLRYQALAGQFSHILCMMFSNQFKDGTIEMSADAFIFYMKDWATMSEVLTNPNIFVDQFQTSNIDGLSSPMLLYAVNSKGFYIPCSNFNSTTLHDPNTEAHFTCITEKVNKLQCNVGTMSDEVGKLMRALEVKKDVHQANMDNLLQISANQSHALNALALSFTDQQGSTCIQTLLQQNDNSIPIPLAVSQLQLALPEESTGIQDEITALQVRKMTLSEELERQWKTPLLYTRKL